MLLLNVTYVTQLIKLPAKQKKDARFGASFVLPFRCETLANAKTETLLWQRRFPEGNVG